jgi:hypothetical protein
MERSHTRLHRRQPDCRRLSGHEPGWHDAERPITDRPDRGHLPGAYRGTVVSPWQTCAAGPPPPEGRINCTTLGNYIHNTRLDYVVRDLSGGTNPVTTQHINTRYGFGGGFFGDYTDMAAGSDNVSHAFWTDSNNEQSVVWWYGLQFVPTVIHQQDVVTGVGP